MFVGIDNEIIVIIDSIYSYYLLNGWLNINDWCDHMLNFNFFTNLKLLNVHTNIFAKIKRMALAFIKHFCSFYRKFQLKF